MQQGISFLFTSYGLLTLILCASLLLGLRFYRLLRPGALRVRLIMPDGRSNTFLTRITRDGDIQIDKKSWRYNEKALTYEGLFKVPTLEYITTSRAPILRRIVIANPNDLSPDAAYDGITSHIMRELLHAFAEGVLTPAIVLIVTVVAVLITGVGVYYGLHKDNQQQSAQIMILTQALITPTPTPLPEIGTVR